MTVTRIRRLSLSNFRSYHAAQIDVGAELVVLTGPNGAGKTNLLEAISFLAPGRGLRRATLEDVAFSEGNGAWAVAADVQGALGLASLGTGIEPPAGAAAAGARRRPGGSRPGGTPSALSPPLRRRSVVPALGGAFHRAG